MNKEPISVAKLNQYIKFIFDSDEILNHIFVRGEISNFKLHTSGHMYFTLKDNDAKIKCVMFRGSNMRLKFMPEDGMKVIIEGNVSVYEKDGQYQFYCTGMQPDGIGSLYMKLEQLKLKLEKEGLFDIENKKPLPILPRRIGVVTSPTGAVIRDIINVASRRFYDVDILLYPAAVQGDGAASTLAEGIKFFNENYDDIDAIIIGRGGGSIEELWPFNDEELARTIFESRIPVVSAVGHETDFTICDFVSDVRASTPSHAAEMVVPRSDELKIRLVNYRTAIETKLDNMFSVKRYYIENCIKSIKLGSPERRIPEFYQFIDNLNYKMEHVLGRRINDYRNELIQLTMGIDAASPAKILLRGYASVKKDGEIIKSIESISKEDKIEVYLKDGKIDCLVYDKMEGVLWQEVKKH